MKNKNKIFFFGVLIILFNVNFTIASKIEKVKSKDGVAVAYTVQGTGAPAIVFVHGWSLDKSIWNDQVKVFSAKYKVVTIDLAGHGESGRSRKNYTMELFGEDVASVVNKLKLEKVILVGHSLGGSVVIEAANILKGKVIGLIGADTFQKFEEGEPADRAEQYLTTFKSNFVGSAKDYASLLFLPNADTLLVNRVAEKMSSANPKIAIDVMRNSYEYNSIASIKKLNVPIISINCEKFPVKLEENRKYVKSFELKKMNGVGHFVMLEDPTKFNQLLNEAIEELTK
jgi:pimeloyl-ACP methyl ester carboxylesterase